MMKLLFPLLLAACAAGARAPRAVPDGPLARLSFMSGCWRGPDGDGMVEETITPADANVMLSMARYVRAGRVTSFEFLRFEARPSGIVLTPYPDGKYGGEFPLLPGDDGTVVFEDPKHDFPKRVIYRRDGADGLIGRIEGDEGDTPGPMEWRMRRCGG